jgi:hypothetical protein
MNRIFQQHLAIADRKIQRPNIMFKKMFSMMVSGVTVAACAVANAGNLSVDNGGFEDFTGGNQGLPSQVANPDNYGTGYTELNGWKNYGYTFAFAPGKAETGSYSPQYTNYLSLWGTTNGGLNSIPATSPVGGNFLVSDPAYQTGPIEQEISGLTVGETYSVSFYWGVAQQNGFTGDTWEGWKVSLGNESHVTDVPSGANPGPDTGTITNPSHAFQGWFQQTMTFTATDKTEILSSWLWAVQMEFLRWQCWMESALVPPPFPSRVRLLFPLWG